MKPTLLEINGETRSIREWSRHVHRPLSTILLRLKQGIDPHEAVYGTSRNLLKIGSRSMTVHAWARVKGAVAYSTIHSRLRRGWPAKRAVFEAPLKTDAGLPTLAPVKRSGNGGMRGRVDASSLPTPILPRWGSSRTFPLEALDVLRRV